MEWIAVGGLGVLIIAAVLALTVSQSRRVESLMQPRDVELERLRKETAALRKRLEGIKKLAEENRAGVQEAKDRVAKVRSTMESEQARLIETRQVLEQIRATPMPGSAVLLREARQNSQVENVERLLLLVTLHRSASTTLFDIFRGHPDVFFESTSSLWNDVGLRGRRYPVDLSNGTSGDVAIEVEPGLGALVPASPGGSRRPCIAIEKAHPQFFDFEVPEFAAHLRSLEGRTSYEISVMYGIRNPLDAMWSMAEYQQRNPAWYRFLDVDSIPSFIERSIVAIDELSTLIPGQIVDYEQTIAGDFALRAAFAGLNSPPLDDRVFEDARSPFAPAARSRTQSGRFLGEGSGARDRQGPEGAWHDSVDTIRRAEEAYGRLRERRGRGQGRPET